MKIIKFSILALLPLLLSCSSSEIELDSSNSGNVSDNLSARFDDVDHSAYNSANPFDISGQLHSEFILSYEKLNLTEQSLPSIVSSTLALGMTNSRFNALSSSAYTFNELALLEQILTPNDSLVEITLDRVVKNKKLEHSFLDLLYELKQEFSNEESYESLYKKIITYESEINLDSSLGNSDKTVVLTTTSVLRHQLRRIKKRPKKNTDPDWDLMITTMGATLEGSTRSVQDAIILSLLTEISLTN